MTIFMQRHHAPIAKRIATTHQRVDVGCRAAAAVVLNQSPTHRCDPHFVVGGICKRGDGPAAEPFRPVTPELPASRIPAADASGIGADPHEPAEILIKGSYVRVAQGAGVALLTTIVDEGAAGAIEQIQTIHRTHPKVTDLIL